MLLDTNYNNMNFFVLHSVTFVLVIGGQTLKRLGAALDFSAKAVQFSCKGKETKIIIVLEYV